MKTNGRMSYMVVVSGTAALVAFSLMCRPVFGQMKREGQVRDARTVDGYEMDPGIHKAQMGEEPQKPTAAKP